MSRTRLLVPIGLLVVAIGCEGKNPAAPSQHGNSVSSLSISGADNLLTGTAANYTVSATSSDGSARTIVPVWTSSDSAVATVNSMGGVEGRRQGSTTLTATYEGRTASKTLRVINNYSGRWQGRYVVKTCTDTGDLTDHDGGWCLAGPERAGSVLSISLTFAHNTNDPTEVIATLPCCRGTITGNVQADGGLTLSGFVILPDWDDPQLAIATIEVGHWESTIDGGGTMMGHWSWVYTSLDGRKGTARSDNELLAMSRVGG